MTNDEFKAVHEKLGITRADLCRKIGISPNSGTAYALGRKPVPLTVALACKAVLEGLTA
jgi:DNA-binding XRE family transcriptional regulator